MSLGTECASRVELNEYCGGEFNEFCSNAEFRVLF